MAADDDDLLLMAEGDSGPAPSAGGGSADDDDLLLMAGSGDATPVASLPASLKAAFIARCRANATIAGLLASGSPPAWEEAPVAPATPYLVATLTTNDAEFESELGSAISGILRIRCLGVTSAIGRAVADAVQVEFWNKPIDWQSGYTFALVLKGRTESQGPERAKDNALLYVDAIEFTCRIWKAR